MRATDIAFFIIFINMSIAVMTTTFFPAMGYPAFTQTQAAQGTNNTGSNGTTTGYIIGSGSYESNNASIYSIVGGAKAQAPDPITGGIMMLWAAVSFIITVFVQSLFLLPTLISVFHIPAPIAILFQTIIWISYGWGIMQMMSGRSGSQME